MDKKKFISSAPGSLLDIGGGEMAFLPAPLPPKEWSLNAEQLTLLIEARQELGVLEGLGRSLPNPQLLLRPLQGREAIRSSSLEGTYATPEELLLFEYDEPEVKSADDPKNSWKEVHNYGRALRFATSDDAPPLSLLLIRAMHEILLHGVRGRDKKPGTFREAQVHIGSTRRFVPPPPLQVHPCLAAMENYINQPPDGHDPLVRAFLVHYQFETIHPFLDGNGRVGRLLLSAMIQRTCGLSQPWLYLSAFFDQYKNEYIDRLFDVSARNDWDGWVEFCLRATLEQASDTIRRAEALRALREDYLRRANEAGGSIRLSKIIEGLFQTPLVRTADLSRSLDVTYPTAKSDVDKLVALNILVKHRTLQPRSHYAAEVIDIAYMDAPVST